MPRFFIPFNSFYSFNATDFQRLARSSPFYCPDPNAANRAEGSIVREGRPNADTRLAAGSEGSSDGPNADSLAAGSEGSSAGPNADTRLAAGSAGSSDGPNVPPRLAAGFYFDGNNYDCSCLRECDCTYGPDGECTCDVGADELCLCPTCQRQ